jgi:hypothetical protein
VLTRNAHNRKSTLTNEYGYAQLKLKGRDDLRLQGIEKDGYDIRLTTLPFNQVWLQGVDKQPKRSNYFKAHQGIHIRYGIGINPYSQPIKNPLFIVRGWKLSSPACLEQDHLFIAHRGMAESEWDIDEKINYYKVGGSKDLLRRARASDFDIRVKLSRSGYPWGNLINKFISSYKLELEFKQGGAQIVAAHSYLHEAPAKGYKKSIKFNYRGIGETSSTHQQRMFIKVGKRYGVLNIEIIPSQRVFFEYLLNRKPNQRELNIPSYMGEYGIAADYFSTPSTASVRQPKTTRPGECASLGLSKFGG